MFHLVLRRKDENRDVRISAFDLLKKRQPIEFGCKMIDDYEVNVSVLKESKGFYVCATNRN
jgi:hypothetical protein